ncbi:MAG: hypothetical protein Q9227_008205 [Pyrenula ochraceoflavens]
MAPGQDGNSGSGKLDSLGSFYVGFTTAWTAILAVGILFLILNRHEHVIRIRNIHLGIAAVCVLHVYWVLGMLVYVMDGKFPCSAEFWIMSVYLPLGMALYQANSTQLLHVAALQKQFTLYAPVASEKSKINTYRGWKALQRKWETLNITDGAMTLIAFGTVFQICLTMFLFFSSRQFHPGFGLWGHAMSEDQCRKGWEWWPSIAWQFAWSWIYAPYLLWKIRDIQDVNGWRLETMLCSVAGLIGSPLWLTSLYSPAFTNINKYWTPPQWFAPGIVTMEATVILFPCYQILRSRRQGKEHLKILSEWEHSRSKHTYDSASDSTTKRASTVASRKASSAITTSTRRSQADMYTFQALEKCLATNPQPLLYFSSRRDFSGENISFLIHVQEWKAAWKSGPSQRFTLTGRKSPKIPDQESFRRVQFNRAVEIYSSFISQKYATFPLNLSSTDQKSLDAIFADTSSQVNATVQDNSATPFDAWDLEAAHLTKSRGDDARSEVSLDSTVVSSSSSSGRGRRGGKAGEEIILSPISTTTTPSGLLPANGQLPALLTMSQLDLKDRVPDNAPIPDSFGAGVFDRAEASTKHSVLMNTWPKFVRAGCAGQLEKRQSNGGGGGAGMSMGAFREMLRKVRGRQRAGA